MLILFGVAVLVGVVISASSPAADFGFGWIGGLIGVIVILWLFSLIFKPYWRRDRYLSRSGYNEKKILKLRYAEGSISRKQYETMMKDLEKY